MRLPKPQNPQPWRLVGPQGFKQASGVYPAGLCGLARLLNASLELASSTCNLLAPPPPPPRHQQALNRVQCIGPIMEDKGLLLLHSLQFLQKLYSNFIRNRFQSFRSLCHRRLIETLKIDKRTLSRTLKRILFKSMRTLFAELKSSQPLKP